jgi:hypothetical protein
MRLKPLVLKNGKKSLLQDGDVLDGQDNFSYSKIEADETIKVPAGQQMLLVGGLTNFGVFKNFGETVLFDLEDEDTQQVIPPPDPENFSHFEIESNEIKIIPQNQQMTVFEQFNNFGMLKNLGDMRLFKPFQEDEDNIISLPDDNFSYKEVLSSEEKTIPTRQQMIVVGMLKNLGQINVFGEISLISSGEETNIDSLPPYLVDSGEVFTIKKNRIMFLPRSLINNGQLNNFGQVALGGL